MSKLYCIATSEKASKGQGGNEYIQIKLKLDDEKEVARVLMKIVGNEAILQIWDINKGELMDRKIYKLKGKSQKGEIVKQLKDDREKDTFNNGMQ